MGENISRIIIYNLLFYSNTIRIILIAKIMNQNLMAVQIGELLFMDKDGWGNTTPFFAGICECVGLVISMKSGDKYLVNLGETQ
jgi:hypothetical protein